MAELCNDCPRRCNVDRELHTGFCGAGRTVRVAKSVIPFTLEEPCLGPLSAVFFSGCSLKCSYCQNHKISRDAAAGAEHDAASLAALFDTMDALDLVTPTHYLTSIERALPLCDKPHRVIWNTSGYETEPAVARERAFTDVFLADLKYYDSALSRELSAAPDYFAVASKALIAMRRTADEWEGDVLRRGLVVRHLVLPGHTDDSVKLLDFIAAELGTDTVISLMSQFTPNGIGAPTRPLKNIEYKRVAEHALKLGFSKGYFQSLSSVGEQFTPSF